MRGSILFRSHAYFPEWKSAISITCVVLGSCVTLKVFGEVSITELSIRKESTPVVIVPTALSTGKHNELMVITVEVGEKKEKSSRCLAFIKDKPSNI